MTAYNAFNGVPAAASRPLLADLLRGQLGFTGPIMTDKFGAPSCRPRREPPACTRLAGGHTHEMMARARPKPGLWPGIARAKGCRRWHTDARPTAWPASPAALDSAVAAKGLGWADGDLRAATAAAISAGVDLIMKNSSALHADDLPDRVLDDAVRRVLHARLRLGHLDPPARLPWAGLNESVIGSREHAATARKLAQQSLVLLKNEQVGGGEGAALRWACRAGCRVAGVPARLQRPCCQAELHVQCLHTHPPLLLLCCPPYRLNHPPTPTHPAQGTLPLRPEALNKVAVVGPFGDASGPILGTYCGAASGPIVSPLAALRAALPAAEVTWDEGTAQQYSQANAEQDAKRCKVGGGGAGAGQPLAVAFCWRHTGDGRRCRSPTATRREGRRAGQLSEWCAPAPCLPPTEQEADACILFLGSRLSRLQKEDFEEVGA